MLKPIAPYIEYAINYDYISKVLCINKDTPELECNGKCYVMKQAKKQQEEDKKALRIAVEEYPIGFVKVITFTSEQKKVTTKEKTNFAYKKEYQYLYSDPIFHPPNLTV